MITMIYNLPAYSVITSKPKNPDQAKKTTDPNNVNAYLYQY